MIRSISKLSEQLKCVAFAELPFEQAVDAQQKALSRFGPVVVRPLGSWAEALALFQPLRTFPRNYIVAGFGDWSLVVCDMIGEPCLVDVCFHSRLSGCRAVGGIAVPQERRFFYIERGAIIRDIECFSEGRWTFRQQGESLGIERFDLYRQRTCSQRLPEHVVLDYVSALTGIHLPLEFKQDTPRLIALERSWHELRQMPDQLYVSNDINLAG